MPEGGPAMPPSGLLLVLLLLGDSGAPPASPPPSAAPWCPFFQASSSEGGLCFRRPARGFECRPRSCTAHRSPGRSLSANVFHNGSVLLQWAWPPPGSSPPPPPPPRGFRLSCSWEGPEARFPCDSVRLGAACRDYFLPEAHGGLRYRLCLQPLFAPGADEEGQGEGECVEFDAEPAGPRDIVVAMAAVGGAICVMLVLICLLVAYLTENLPPARPPGRPQA